MKKRKLMLIGLSIILFVLIISVIIFTIKSNTKSPVVLTRNYMERYLKLDKDLVKNIKYEYDDDITPTQKEKYIEVMKRQYENMTYNITNEQVNAEDATITVEFMVFDLSAAMDRANSYIEVYSDKFMKNDKFDPYKAIDYKLKFLSKYDEKVSYSIDFIYLKENGKWRLMELSDVDLKKLNGTY